MIVSFKEFIAGVLLEDRIETLKMLHPALDTSHDTHGQHKGSELIDHIASHDPTKNKQYTQWMINRYKEKNFRQEDLGRVKQALTDFHQHKGKLQKKDINQYKKVSDVEDAVEPHLGTVSKKQEKAQIKHEGAELIHDHDGVTVHHIKTEAAACHYGAGTKWCTAAKNNNMFDHYNKDGPLFVIQHQGRKYQFHTESYQFMDEKDNRVTYKDVHPTISKSLAKSNHPEILKHNILQYNDHLSSQQITHGMKDSNLNVRTAAVSHPNATAEHITQGMKDSELNVRAAAVSHPNATAEHITQGMKDSDLNVRTAAVSNSKATSEHISQAMKDTNWYVRRAAISHPKANVEHITQGMQDAHWNVRRAAVSHPNATAEHITQGMNDTYWDVREAAVSHPNATDDHIRQGMKDRDFSIREASKHIAKERGIKIE